MSTPISIRGLSKQYRLGEYVGSRTFREMLTGLVRRTPRTAPETLWALRDISLEISDGEVLGVIGRNGSGKSTLLKVLTGITEPTEGEVHIRGRVASLLEVGTGFHGELTGRENIFLNGSILGMSRTEIRRKFDEIVSFSGVEKFLDTPVKRYSSGMYMRLAFSVAAHLDQEIMLVDEVLAVGDFDFQKKCLGKMDDVARTGRTVLFVSHNMAAVRRLCARTALLSRGELVFVGPTADAQALYLQAADRAEKALDWVAADEATNIEIRPTTWEIEIDVGGSIELEFEVRSQVPLAGLDAGVLLSDIHGQPLLGTKASTFGHVSPVTNSDRWRVRAALGSPTLLPGRYPLNLYVGDSAVQLATYTNVMTLVVSELNPYGIESFPSAWGQMYADAEWSMIPISADQAPDGEDA